MSTIFHDNMLVLLIVVSALASLFNLLSAIKTSNDYINRFKQSVVLVLLLGLIFGIIKSTGFVISNKYVQYKMWYLTLDSFSSIINNFLLTALSTALLVFVTLFATRTFLNFIRVSEKASNVIVCGVIPSLLLFFIGGYWLNREYLHQFFELRSMIGNGIWFIICATLVWAIGRLVLNLSQIGFNFANNIGGVRSSIVVLSLAVCLNLVNYFYFSSLAKDHPNVILISVDTLRADHLSSYGYNRKTSPNIDEFVRDGVLFRNTIAQSSSTLPSHMSMLTGLYPSSHGVIRKDRRLNNGHLTLGEVLQNAGYKTVAITDGAYVSRRYGYQGFHEYDESGSIKSANIERTYLKAVEFLRKEHPGPFFLFLHTYQVHCPYDPPRDYDIYSDKNYQGIVEVSEKCSDYYDDIKPQMVLNDYHYVIDKYDSNIFHTDRFLGKLFSELRRLGLYDNSIIVFTSDHGENFLDHPSYSINHAELYDEIVKVPLIVKAPNFPKNQVIDTQVESIDIMPTVLELLRIPIPNRIDGASFVELTKKKGSHNVGYAFSERFEEYKMLRSNYWKLLRRSEKDVELFDLENDPKEQNNLVVEKREIARSLYDILETWVDSQEEKSKLFSSDQIQIDDKLTDQLKALGYVN